MNDFGFSEKDLQQIRDILKQFNEIEEVIIFGSRAINKFKPASDVDIAIKGGKINSDLILKMSSLFEESSLPYFFDIINYNDIENPDLKFHIDKYGKILI